MEDAPKSEKLDFHSLSEVVTYHVRAMLAYWDRDLVCRYANEAYCRWFGKTREELVDKMTMKDLWGPMYEMNWPHAAEALKGHQQTFEREVPARDGTMGYALANYMPHIVDGKVMGFIAHITDVGALKVLEKEISAKQAHLKAVLESSVDQIWAINGKYELVTFNQNFVEHVLATIGRFPKENDLVFYPEYGVKRNNEWRALYDRALEGEQFIHETQFFTAEGEIFLQFQFCPIREHSGPVTGVSISGRDITAAKHHADELESKANFIEAVKDSIPCFIYVNDRVHRKMTYVNRYFTALTGFERDEINALPGGMFSLIHPADQPEMARKREMRDRGGMHQLQVEFRIRTSKGDYRWISITDTGFKFDAKGNVLENLGVGIDITARVETENALRAAKEAAESAAKLKSDFLSVMSHEIRTPLNAVIGFAELLASSNPRSDQKEFIDIVQFSARNLLGLVNDFLDYSKMDSGKLSFENRPFELCGLLDQAAKLFAGKAAEKGVQLVFSKPEETEVWLSGDPFRLSQILNNLLGNAVKFTSKGSIRLSFAITERTDERITVAMEVKDTGIGISEEMQALVFEPFTQAEKGTSREYGGTGLGLAITKRLVELQGGELQLASQSGVGSTFSFAIAYGIAEPEEQKPAATAWTDHDLKGMRILLAEDNAMNVMLTTKILEKWNCEMAVAANGAEALEMVQQSNFHLILMDLQMPVMDGYAATAAIRRLENPEVASIPIIALTANVPSEMVANPNYNGFNGFIPKPFDIEQLHSKLAEYRWRQE